jgi:hypothetical protein
MLCLAFQSAATTPLAIVMDRPLRSLAGLVRMEFDNRQLQDMTARTTWLFGFAQELKMMSELFRVAVVVVNQVQGSGFTSDSNAVSGRVPALGLAW